MSRNLVLIYLFASLAGCASEYRVANDVPTAKFVIANKSDSTGTTVVETYAAAHADEACGANKHGTKIGGDSSVHGGGQTAPARIAANEKFVFTTSYVEARFGQNRSCAITASFMPLADHRYVALIFAKNQVAECSLGVYDVTRGQPEPVQFHLPELACNGKPNGTTFKAAIDVNWLPVLPGMKP
jgi:hypothetical protein